MENKNVSNMQPKKGDTTINLPITFDFSGGRRDAMKSRKFWGIGLAVVGVIIGLGIMFSKRHFFLIDWVLGFHDKELPKGIRCKSSVLHSPSTLYD